MTDEFVIAEGALFRHVLRDRLHDLGEDAVWLSCQAGVSSGVVREWIAGTRVPVERNVVAVCSALGIGHLIQQVWGAYDRSRSARWLVVSACGTESGYNRHRRRGEPPCQPCHEVSKHKATKIVSSSLTGTDQEHGTCKGYRQHLALGESPCDACREAQKLYSADWARDRRRKNGIPERPKGSACGTTGGEQQHRRNGEKPCDACRAAGREYDRQRQGSQPFAPAVCGTEGGYSRHLRLKEDICDACRNAMRPIWADRAKARRALSASRR